ncbi:hypothetical protein B0H11DRAFT_1905202 [Mycena galericulata]|nr:hypothetical protein B0H11DRAFT_1905202 [Mycena galericulata]
MYTPYIHTPRHKYCNGMLPHGSGMLNWSLHKANRRTLLNGLLTPPATRAQQEVETRNSRNADTQRREPEHENQGGCKPAVTPSWQASGSWYSRWAAISVYGWKFDHFFVDLEKVVFLNQALAAPKVEETPTKLINTRIPTLGNWGARE